MWDLLLIMLIAVLFNHLGLADTVTFHTKRNVVLNCSKCLTFWTSLGYSLLVLQWGCIPGIAVSFTLSYLALWVELLLNLLNLIYKKTYGKIYPSETGERDSSQTD